MKRQPTEEQKARAQERRENFRKLAKQISHMSDDDQRLVEGISMNSEFINATKHQPFLWPDHVIGKRESRRLRDKHNALYNSHAELIEALEAILESFVHIPGSEAGNKLRTQIFKRCENVKTAVNNARAAIAKAKGNQ